MAGQVLSGDRRIEKAGEPLLRSTPLRLKRRKRRGYVSRGGEKLEGGLEHFKIDPQGRCCLDLGASTGGFSDCLLQRGAQRVYAVDVGYGLLDWKLRGDERLIALERTHARDLSPELISEPIDLLVADISFNALARILEPALELLSRGADLLLLVKPQFELPREQVPRGGVIYEEALQQRACERVAASLQGLGLAVQGWTPSQLRGTRGNQEYLLYAQS